MQTATTLLTPKLCTCPVAVLTCIAAQGCGFGHGWIGRADRTCADVVLAQHHLVSLGILRVSGTQPCIHELSPDACVAESCFKECGLEAVAC